MLTAGGFARQCDERALKAAASARQPEDGGGWLASRMFDGGRGAGSEAEMLRREVSRTPEERDGTDPAAGVSPSRILRELQEQQVAGVITARMPGPRDWAYLERDLPGGPAGDSGQALKSGPALTPQHSAAEGEVDAPDDDGDQAEEARRRVQHEADPCSEPAEAPEVAYPELGKAYRDAVPGPGDFPVPFA